MQLKGRGGGGRADFGATLLVLLRSPIFPLLIAPKKLIEREKKLLIGSEEATDKKRCRTDGEEWNRNTGSGKGYEVRERGIVTS